MESDLCPCLALTTWPADRSPDALVNAVVTARLAACVHVAPAGVSTYRWEGAVERAHEHQLVFKTTRARLAALETFVRGAHPYAVPEWLVVDVTGSAAYLTWIAASVAAVPDPGDG